MAPSTVSSLQDVLAASKFSAPTSDDQVDDLQGYCSQYFFMQARPCSLKASYCWYTAIC